jgi:hypothetical protein
MAAARPPEVYTMNWRWRSLTGLCLAAIALPWVLLPTLVEAARIEGYPTAMSVPQGGTLELHVRCESSAFSLTIWRQGRQLEQVATAGTHFGFNYPIPAQAWEGCNWPVSCSLPVPRDWRPGAYLARLDTDGAYTFVPFVVRALHPGAYSRMVVQLSTNTWQAYNRYGGKSLYGAWAPGLVGRASKVSFHRPYDYLATDGSGQFFLWEAPFLAWLESQGYAYEVCTNQDLHADPELLSPYNLFVSVGHDEYYSKEMFDALEHFVDAGGNLAFLSANTLWWQVRFENDNQTVVCFKDARLDPLNGVDNARVTVNWHAAPVLRPPARLMGIYFNGSWGIPAGGYHVVSPHHWAFQGTQVDSNQAFGYPMVAFEIDSRTPDSPPILDVIARIELPDANDGGVMRPCEMVYYERTAAYGFPGGSGAKVFSSGTVNYSQGLMQYYNAWTKTTGREDRVARALTLNVLDKLACTLTPPRLQAPIDSCIVVGTQVQLRWQAAAAQRPGIAVHYRVLWQFGTEAVQQLETSDSSAWIPVRTDSAACRWWVEAEADCGLVTTSDRTAWFVSRLPLDTEGGTQPLLSIVRGSDRIQFVLWTSQSTRGRVEIHDVAGRLVHVFGDRPLTAGRNVLEWSLAAGGGERVAAGIYFVTAHVGTQRVDRKIVILHR